MSSLAGYTVLFGGSFDPPHVGHQMACLYLLEALEADEVWPLPTHLHPFGKARTDFEQRFEMCRLAFAPLGERVRISRDERREGATGRTYDTLVWLREQHPERRFALGVGADVLQDASKWYRWPELVAMVRLVVVGRAGYPSEAATPVELPAVSSTQVRALVARGASISGFVPAAVARYISRRGLYRDKL